MDDLWKIFNKTNNLLVKESDTNTNEISCGEQEIVLSDEQESVFELINSGENVLITGDPGTGKSILVREICKRYPDTTVTATTGVAAVNISGMTVHSWSGIGIDETTSISVIANRIIKHPEKKERIDNCKRLIIDEISMLKADVFDRLDQLLRLVRNKNIPFGGIQILLFGDFLQLPPVETRKDSYGNKLEVKFCFEGRSWNEADIKILRLTKVFRQSEKELCDLLKRIREAKHTIDDIKFLQNRQNISNKKCVKIFGTNKEVDDLNSFRLEKLKGDIHEFERTDYFSEKLKEEEIAKFTKDFDSGCLAPTILKLKVGARVMMLRNLSISTGIANGSCGTVTGFDEETGCPIVLFDNGVERTIGLAKWEIKDNQTVIASREQYPLRLAYAITSQKSQGLTLENVECDFTKCYFDAQVYVALSRVKSIEGLFVVGLANNKIKANKKAINFYNFLSEEESLGV